MTKNEIFGKVYWWAIATIIIAGLLMRAVLPNLVYIDPYTITLILLLMLLPSVENRDIQSLDWWIFKAQIRPDEGKKIKTEAKPIKKNTFPIVLKVNKVPTIGTNFRTNQDIKDLSGYLLDLSDTDPTLALAKLRMELESEVRFAYNAYFKETPHKTFNVTLSSMLSDLYSSGQIDQRVVSVTRDIIPICNRAIHGGRIDTKTAKNIISGGLVALEWLHHYGWSQISHKKN